MTIDSPEVAGGQSGTLSPLPTAKTTQTNVPGLSSSQVHFIKGKGRHGSNTAAIVGGVLGGIVFIALTVTLMLWRQRVKRRKATRKAASVILGHRISAVPLQEKKRNRDDPLPPDAIPSAI